MSATVDDLLEYMQKHDHQNFVVKAEVSRITNEDDGPVVCYHLDMSVTCADCGADLEFVGLRNGCSFYHPTVSIDGKTARFPMVRAGESVPAGMPGFGVKHIQAEEKTSRPN